MKHSLRGYLRLAAATFSNTRKTFGVRTARRMAVMAAFLPPLLLLQTLHWLGFCLDERLFPGYRNVRVKQPLFVVGVPRSGTTFLHRVLARDEARFTTPALWELVFAPSVAERRLLMLLGRIDKGLGRPLGKVIDRIQEQIFAPLGVIHPMRLTDPEEDYFSLLPVLGCFLLVLPFPDAEEIWRLSRFDQQVPTPERRRIAAFYRSMAQRHLYARGPGKQLLSKNPSFTPMVRTLAETFPDARIVACVRHPNEAIASELSAMMEGMKAFGNRTNGDDFRDRIVALMLHYYRHILRELATKDSKKAAVVGYDAMKADIEATVRGIYRQFQWPVSAAMDRALGEEAEKSRTYVSRHRYSLERFQLTAEGIARQGADVFPALGYAEPAGRSADE